MTPRSRGPKSPKPEPATERRDFTFRPDGETWKRLIRYCREVEDSTGKMPSKNTILLDALTAWLDRAEKRRR